MAAKYELQDLPKFGDDKNKGSCEFMYQFDNFLRYIELNITSPAKVENAIELFGSCMHKEARSCFETHICHTSIHCYHNKTPTVPHTLTQH